MGWVSTYPFDVCKTRLQAVGTGTDASTLHYKGMIDCFIKTFREGGLRTFGKGLGATIARSVPVNAVTFVGYTLTLRYLDAYELQISMKNLS